MKKRKKEIIELVKYVFFGGLTTLVSLGSFMLFDWILGEKLYLLTNFISGFISVVFAFITNKLWVFESKSWKGKIVWKEALSFAGARLLSFGIEEAGLWLLVSILGMGKMAGFALFGYTINGNVIAKVIMMVIVVILNYVFSKFIIFKKKKSE